MHRRFIKLLPKIFFHKGIDILVTHAPAYEINDGNDLPHKGFLVFRDIIQRYHPKYFFHGHVHKSYGHNFKRFDEYEGTTIVNACEKCIIEY
jgi:Icc-related predicted phosphoesterase